MTTFARVDDCSLSGYKKEGGETSKEQTANNTYGIRNIPTKRIDMVKEQNIIN